MMLVSVGNVRQYSSSVQIFLDNSTAEPYDNHERSTAHDNKPSKVNDKIMNNVNSSLDNSEEDEATNETFIDPNESANNSPNRARRPDFEKSQIFLSQNDSVASVGDDDGHIDVSVLSHEVDSSNPWLKNIR